VPEWESIPIAIGTMPIFKTPDCLFNQGFFVFRAY